MTATGPIWAKLDTAIVDSFDAALGPRGLRIDTATRTTLRFLADRTGWAGAAKALFAALAHPEWRLVSGNINRKRHRLPAVFGHRIPAGIYGWMKAVEASLLQRRLRMELTDHHAALVYNGASYPESVLADVARTRNLPCLLVEQGFFPNTLQIDPLGLNAANSVPRDPAFYRAGVDFTTQGLPELAASRPGKRRGDGPVPLDPGYVFVAFQVPSDMQVTVHSPWIHDMAQFLSVIRHAADRHPGDRFVIKEHPSFPLSVRKLFPPHPRVIFANDNLTSDLIAGARAVVTLNSTVGIEAMMANRPVIVLADACYDMPGLTLRARNDAELSAALTARDWRPDDDLRRQVLGFLWSHYLTRGSYAAPPADLATRLDLLLTPDWQTVLPAVDPDAPD